jgi:putative ABC transport system permease protein
VKTNPQADMASVNEKLVNLEKELVGWTEESGQPYEQYFFFQPVTSIHLHSHRRQEVQVNGDIKKVYIYASIALLILIISCINYINLSAAMGEKRHEEFGIRKVFGAKTLDNILAWPQINDPGLSSWLHCLSCLRTE